MKRLEDQLFNLKFTAKQIEREAKKSKNEESKERARVIAALKENRPEVARVYAENAIRNRNQYNTLTAMAAQISAVASRVQSAAQVGKISESLGQVVKELSISTNNLNPEKLTKLMTRFEQEFETLDAKTSVLNGAMSNTTTLLAPDEEVNNLLKESADAANIDLNLNMPELNNTKSAPSSEKQDDLTDRLARLRN